MRARRITALSLAVLLGAGALAACSDDDGGTPDIALEDIDDDAPQVDDDDATTTTAAPDDDEDDVDTTDTTLAGGDFAEGCAEFSEAFTGLAASLGVGGEVDESALDDFDAAIADAPEDIQDDLQVYAEAFRAYAQALEEAGFDPDDPDSVDPEDAAALAELAETFSSEEFVAASTAINEFVASNCAAG